MNDMKPMPTVAKLRAELDNHVRWWPSNPLGTARDAVDALERLAHADPSEVFKLLGELRGEAR